MKRRIFSIFLITSSILLYGQNTNVTNNNTITIQGNVYYFQPSTTPSSPPPTQSSDFLSSGSWYGENAARAWASIADWVIDHCTLTSPAIRRSTSEIIYISAVHVIKSGDRNFNNLATNTTWSGGAHFNNVQKQVRIDYWVVRTGSPMVDGKRETRWFGF